MEIGIFFYIFTFHIKKYRMLKMISGIFADFGNFLSRYYQKCDYIINGIYSKAISSIEIDSSKKKTKKSILFRL